MPCAWPTALHARQEKAHINDMKTALASAMHVRMIYAARHYLSTELHRLECARPSPSPQSTAAAATPGGERVTPPPRGSAAR
mmetsp:Transcript_110568/g.323519  ORF Transcript_110568/g.323519 Transcript_110568/m.323519 type:complete len:82 (+) Transcript_110568:116-361(+)